jgi:hypothetical protein
VYFIAPYGEAAIKIGKTANNPSTRLQSLQTGHHEKLSYLAYAKFETPELAAVAENRLHTLFAEERAACEGGSEWFVMSDRLRKFVERVGFDAPTGLAAAIIEL